MHTFARLKLVYATDIDLKRIGLMLKALGRLRNAADYQLAQSSPFPSARIAVSAMTDSEAAVALLGALDANPARRATAMGSIPAWFKNTRFRVTLGISARTLIGPALERVYASRSFLRWGLQLGENRVYPRSSSQRACGSPVSNSAGLLPTRLGSSLRRYRRWFRKNCSNVEYTSRGAE
ncbi:MAG: hypothetical protein ACXVBY_09620 [Isosphaeraceae bacterium]